MAVYAKTPPESRASTFSISSVPSGLPDLFRPPDDVILLGTGGARFLNETSCICLRISPVINFFVVCKTNLDVSDFQNCLFHFSSLFYKIIILKKFLIQFFFCIIIQTLEVAEKTAQTTKKKKTQKYTKKPNRGILI